MHTRLNLKLVALLFLLLLPLNLPVAQTAAPAPSSQTIQLAGLTAPVTVRRDGRGIPYIEAATEDDLYFAQGYATASDRLWQMDLLRRTARGELAEIFGTLALEEDKRRRLYGFARVSEESAARLPADARRVLDAYARGVNAFITSLEGKPLPREFIILGYRPRAWTAADTLVVGKIFAEVLTRSWQADIQRAALADLAPELRRELIRDDSPLDVLMVGADANAPRVKSKTSRTMQNVFGNEAEQARTVAALAEIEALQRRTFARVGLDLEEFAASNNWVVSGKRTASGKPLLANDPHLSASAPSIWYMTHLALTTGARPLRVAGVTAPGVPGVIIGHNNDIAWGVTNFGPDVQDIFLETFDPQDPTRYRTATGWEKAIVRREEIKVRKGIADASTKSEFFEVTTTRHGPIVFESAGKRYALRWTALEASSEAELPAFYDLNRAQNWREVQAALSRYAGPTQNFVYADRAGNIGYYAAGRIPIRRDRGGSLPYDGTKPDGDVVGFIPFGELPHTFNPPSGIIVTANNRLVGRDYKHFIGDEWAAPYRARRIHDLLAAEPKHTTETFRRILGDTYTLGGATFANATAKALREAVMTNASTSTGAADAKLAETISLFEKWDGRADAASLAAPLIAEMRTSFRRRILVGIIGGERAKTYRGANIENFIDRVIAERKPEFLPKDAKTYGDLFRLCYDDARAELTKRLGADESKWTWGAYAPIRFPHPLASVPFIGSQFVIPAVPGNGSGFAAGATVNVGANVSMRFIADTNDWDASQQGIALGQSGDATSPHWADQLADWRTATPGVFPFTSQAVKRATTQMLVLTPSAR
jgi:penicillin amidase